MDIRLIAVGMGGAFLSDQKTYNRERFTAQYRQMKVQGTRFVVTGGNQYHQLISFLPKITNEIVFVAGNGGWVAGEGKDVSNDELSKDTFTAVARYLLTRSEAEIVAYGKSSAYTPKKYDDTTKAVTEMYYRRLEYVNNFDNLEDIFFKFGLNLSDELIPQIQKALHEVIDDIMVPVHTDNGSTDLIIPSVRKANGLRQLQKLWGIGDSEVVVFGDGGSGIEMLRQAGFSFAMKSVGNAVVAAAKYRAGSNNCEGVLDVTDRVLEHEALSDQ